MRYVFYLVSLTLVIGCNFCFSQGQAFIMKVEPVKRGQSYNIIWPVHLASGAVRFELNEGVTRVWEESNIENSGMHSVKFPTHLKPGKDYNLSIFNGNEIISKSDMFTVKRKIPLVLWFSPIVITGVILLILPKENRLPSPPDPIAPN